jgi:hypothetical protein
MSTANQLIGLFLALTRLVVLVVLKGQHNSRSKKVQHNSDVLT